MGIVGYLECQKLNVKKRLSQPGNFVTSGGSEILGKNMNRSLLLNLFNPFMPGDLFDQCRLKPV